PLSDAQLDKLAKLADLHKNGILTEEEFEKEKNLIINR
ncbi:MAG: SHOCT domain-containing protein, partial [Bacilli bacterium]|nr:SHOCT domain-containing protein [Bacilli bacterium]